MDALVSRPQLVWVAAVFEQVLDNAVVLAREADKQLGLVEEDSKVCVCVSVDVSLIAAPCVDVPC